MIELIPFETYGAEDLSNGGPVLFAHANAYPPGTYRSFLKHFTKSTQIMAPYHRPLWPGESPEDLSSWDQIADDVINFCDQNNLRRIAAVGHSLGAAALMTASVMRPEYFHSLTLIEPVILHPTVLAQIDEQSDLKQREKWPWVARALKRRNEWSSLNDAFRHFRKKDVFNRWSDEVLWDYINSGLRKNADSSFTLAYSPNWEARVYTLAPTNIWTIIPRVTLPTLAVRGIDSDTLNPEAWSLWKERQPLADFVELSDCGHLLPMERPAISAATVMSWIQQSA